MMNTKKVTLFAVIMVIAFVAVGIGYAYTASTQNSGNDVSSEYISLVQGGSGAYVFSNDSTKVEWNSVDKKVGETYVTEYTIQGMTPGAEADHMEGYNIKQFGDSFTILTKGEEMGSHPNLECIITNSWGWLHGDDYKMTYFVKVVNNTTITWFKYCVAPHEYNPTFQQYNDSTHSWDGGSSFVIAYDGAKYCDTTVTTYIAIEGNALSFTHAPGEVKGPIASPLGGAFIYFNVSNP